MCGRGLIGRVERDADDDRRVEHRKTFALTTAWQRISFTANLGQATTSVTFGAQLAAGAIVDLFGMQVEAQLAPSDYKMTTRRAACIRTRDSARIRLR